MDVQLDRRGKGDYTVKYGTNAGRCRGGRGVINFDLQPAITFRSLWHNLVLGRGQTRGKEFMECESTKWHSLLTQTSMRRA